MRAAVVAVGTELLSTDRLDTNSLRIAELLGIQINCVELFKKRVGWKG